MSFKKKHLKVLKDEQFNIVLKARQMGISTLVSGYALWLMTFFTDKSILCIAIKPRNCKKYCYESNTYVRTSSKLTSSECTEKKQTQYAF